MNEVKDVRGMFSGCIIYVLAGLFSVYIRGVLVVVFSDVLVVY